MSNLGFYQKLTTFIKKCGGPKKFSIISITTLLATGGIVTESIRKTYNHFKNNEKNINDKKIYHITRDITYKYGLSFKIGDTYRVLESDGDSVLIEKIGDPNNPYFISSDILKNISNYKK